MEPIEPRAITGIDWSVLPWLVYALWGVVIFNVLFAGAMLLGHAVLPSLMATGHIQLRFQRVRPILYILGLGALLVSIIIVVSFVATLPIVYDLYPKRLI